MSIPPFVTIVPFAVAVSYQYPCISPVEVVALIMLEPSISHTKKSPSAAPVISTVSPISLSPPVSESNTHDMLHAVTGTASVISMNMQTIRQAPSDVNTSLTLPLLSCTSALVHHQSSIPLLFHLILSFGIVGILIPRVFL